MSESTDAPGPMHRRLRPRDHFRVAEIPFYIHWVHQKPWPPHDHDFIECVLVTHGTAINRTELNARQLRKGDVLLIPPGTWHAYEQCRQFRICNLCFGSEILRRDMAWLLETPLFSYLACIGQWRPNGQDLPVLHLSGRQYQEVLQHLKAMTGLLERDPASHRAGIVGRMLLLLDLFAQEYHGNRSDQPAQKIPPAVARAMQLLEEKPAQQWSIRRLSEQLDISYSYLIRLFKSSLGLSPLAYLSKIRARRAAYLLLNSDQSIGNIAEAVGWPSPYYFSRRFREHFGMAASEYRKQTFNGQRFKKR